MNPLSLTVGPFEAECYLVAHTGVLVIDPGSEAETIIKAIASLKAPVIGYLLTHGHADHISALNALTDAHPAPVFMHEADAAWAFTEANQIPPFYEPPRDKPKNMTLIRDEQTLQFGAQTVAVIATPGHTPGSVCYLFPAGQCLFSGDTLFHGSVGRTDLPGGNGRLLQASLKKMQTLPGKTSVCPGHGPRTTIAEQLRINPFMQPQPFPQGNL